MTRTVIRTNVLLSLLLLSLSACEEEKKDPNEGEELPDLTEGLEDFEPFKFNELELPFKTPEECIANAADKRDDTTAQTECLCNKCLDFMQECEVLPGCLEIRACSVETGCSDELTCYLFPSPIDCVEVIDKWGNASLATAVSVDLMDCMNAQGCR